MWLSKLVNVFESEHLSLHTLCILCKGPAAEGRKDPSTTSKKRELKTDNLAGKECTSVVAEMLQITNEISSNHFSRTILILQI